jgi:glycosyltransferase involved in cell wall biosynthesis
MIRLLSIQPVAERGGSDQAQLRMLRSLPSDEFECHVVVPAEPPLRPELEAAGVTVHIVPMERISTSHGVGEWFGYAVGWPPAVWRIARLVRELHIDVVHTNSLHSWYGWAAAWLTRTPHVWHAREIVVQSGAALRVERLLTRHGATKVIAMSRAIADQLDVPDVVIVHETADPADFNPERAGRFRPRVGIPDDAPLAGSAGRIDTWKGIHVLLAAWRRVKEARPEAHLVVAGGPVKGKEDYCSELAEEAGGLADAHWLGHRDDLADLYADLDVFVLASTEPEPYGLVAVEALASGAMLLATDAGGPPEILASAHRGAGELVPPGDADALADALVALLDRSQPTSSARRAARPPLRDPEPEGFAAVFRDVVGGPQES